MVERIETLTHPPVVGQVYSVPCINYGGHIYPIMGFVHRDEVLGPNAAKRHIHVNICFVTQEALASLGLSFVDVYPTIGVKTVLASVRIGESEPIPRRFEKELTCLRELPNYTPSLHGQLFSGASIDHFGRLEEQQEGKAYKGKCMSCPHRGIPLGWVEVRNGKRLCPGHLLAFDATTGQLVRRTKKVGDEYQPR